MKGWVLLRIDEGAGEPQPRAWLPLLPIGGLNRGFIAILPEEWFRRAGLSRWGDSPNISSREAEVLKEVFPRLLNLNGGA